MPDAPAPILPAYTPATPTAPPNIVGTGAISAPSAPDAVIGTAPITAPVAATLLINPTGDNNSILLTAKNPGVLGNQLRAGLLVGDLGDDPTDNSAPSVLFSGGVYNAISGPAYRMTVGGELSAGETPIDFPELLAAPVVSGRAAWTDTGLHVFPNIAPKVIWSATKWVLKYYNDAEWESTDNVQSPALVTTWSGLDASTGTPVLTPLAATAAQMIAAINADDDLPFTAADGPGSDGSGVVAPVSSQYFSGGIGPAAPTAVFP